MKCDKAPYDKEADLAEHLMTEHGLCDKIKIDGKTEYVCVICSEIFDDKSDLAKDLMWVHGLAAEIPEEYQ